MPSRYRATLGHGSGFRMGPAEVDTLPRTGSRPTRWIGYLGVVRRPAGSSGGPSAPRCAPGRHAEVWQLALNGPTGVLVLPVAVDRTAAGVTVTVCLDAIAKLGLRTDQVYMATAHTFVNPTGSRLAWISARVTPYGTGNLPDPGAAYEALASEPLPQRLTLKPVYVTSTKILGIIGSYSEPDEGTKETVVAIFAGTSRNLATMRRVEIADGTGGTFTTTTLSEILRPDPGGATHGLSMED